ncbi:MerR family transcriptional regulator [Streptomyces sp. H27-D2]|uniref:MerR family transcriptional regulator n=1 Tax=Streptomyces sp. H27-D2 TaxID=3046304 RepID=UPI002DC01E31|nr:MerR family transcriptional regulator [Streptomyces sp. H27-D2]MEC4015949.1 MerR family transcriptional regulator [Streptomyces sp. H27-D2]
MRIGQLARLSGVSTRLLRYYEEQGLLRAERDSNDYRRYGPEAPELVARIRGLLAAGLSTDVIRGLLPCAPPGTGLGLVPCDAVRDTLREQLSRTDADIAELLRSREVLAGYSAATEERSRSVGGEFVLSLPTSRAATG